jgi:hypothetical protein
LQEFLRHGFRRPHYDAPMARLTPAELQQARRASGNLGGRPRKPTVDEARAEALARLTPKAIRVLEEQLDAGGKDAWRPALRVLDHAWGRPPEHLAEPELPVPTTVDEIKNMPTAQLLALVRESSRSEGASSDEAMGASAPAQDEEHSRRP